MKINIQKKSHSAENSKDEISDLKILYWKLKNEKKQVGTFREKILKRDPLTCQGFAKKIVSHGQTSNRLLSDWKAPMLTYWLREQNGGEREQNLCWKLDQSNTFCALTEQKLFTAIVGRVFA